MDIKPRNVTVRELAEDYLDEAEGGVTAYGGDLDVRPPYQREFVYSDDKRDEVVRTVLKGLPLNVMYWCDRGEEFDDDDDTPRYEVMDGQQRTISICQYVDGAFSVDDLYFDNQPKDIQDKILDYPLFIYVCSGTDSEKLEWFRIINIAGEKLTDQELRNAVYAGPFVTNAKKYFSKTGCAASQIAGDYLTGSSIRQEFLETALSWIANRDNTTIEGYMAKHQADASAVELWNYFSSVISWVEATFPVKRKKEMKGVRWGVFYNDFHVKDEDGNMPADDLKPDELEKQIKTLMMDDDVSNRSGIYEYVLYGPGHEKALNIRKFDDRDKRAAYERQDGKCAICGKQFDIDMMEADHIVPWSKGGHTTPDNCQMLCRKCNREKSNK